MYKKLSAEAVFEERNGNYKGASLLWLEAKKHAKSNKNEDCCQTRFEFCIAADKRLKYL